MQPVAKTIVVGILAATVVAFAVAILSSSSRSDAGNVLIFGMGGSVGKLDPHVATGWSTTRVAYQVFEGLVKEDLTDPAAATPALVPALAERWSVSDDGRIYTFHLRRGVRFHDGSPFDAAAVKFNFDRIQDRTSAHYYQVAASYVKAYASWIDRLEVIDEATVEVVLKHPNREWLRLALQSYGPLLMVSPSAVRKHGNEGFALQPSGTGPFRFVSKEQGVRIVLARNEDYWGQPPRLDGIIFWSLKDPATRVNALLTGEVHIVDNTPVEAVVGVDRESVELTFNDNVPNLTFLHLNTRHPALVDVRVRRAINLAIDRVAMARDLFNGTAQPAFGMLPRGTFAYDESRLRTRYRHDPAAARALLDAAGFGSGLDLTLEGIDRFVPTFAWLERDLRRVGIRLSLDQYQSVAYLGRWAGGMEPSVAMNSISWGMSVPSWIGMVARCDAHPPNGNNAGWYCNEHVDAVLRRALTAQSDEEAASCYEEANELIMADAAFVPLLHDRQPMLISKQVGGFVNPAQLWYDLSTVFLRAGGPQ